MTTRSVQNQPGVKPQEKPQDPKQPQAEPLEGADEKKRVSARKRGAVESPHNLIGPIKFDRSAEVEFRRIIGVTRASLQQELLEYITPKLTDTSILRPERVLLLLNALQSEVLPKLNDNEDIKSLAKIIIENEINRYRDLLDRLHHGLPT